MVRRAGGGPSKKEIMAFDGTHITGNVSIDDVKTALVLSNNDIGGLVNAGVAGGKINKWAKWKPLKSTSPITATGSAYVNGKALHYSTVEERKLAGAGSQYDTGVAYGVRGAVAYSGDSILELHTRNFTYDAPGTSGEIYRLSDFRHPTNSSYGYKKNATCNLNGVAYKWGNNSSKIYVNTDSALFVNLTYSTRANNNEEINIEDFFHSTVNIANCYPCIMMTVNDGTYIHCLYPEGSSSLTTLGNHPQGMNGASWKLDLTSSGVPATLNQSGKNCTWTVFLVSNRYLKTANQWDISTWINASNSPGGEVWQSDLVSIPDLAGLVWTLSSNDLPFFNISSITANSAGNGFRVTGGFSDEYTRPDTSVPVIVNIYVTLYETSDTSYTNPVGTHTYTLTINANPDKKYLRSVNGLFTDFDILYSGQAHTYIVRANATVNYGALTPSTSQYKEAQITWSAT